MARIVLNTFGSFGDVHPYLAIAIELQRRGHSSMVATSEVYRQKIIAEGVDFFPVRPDVGELLNQPDLIRKLWHPSKGTTYLLRDYLLPKIEQSYADLRAACTGADLLLTHAAGYAGPVVAEVLQIPWLSVALQPAIFFSQADPPVIAALPWTRHLYHLGSWAFAAMLAVAKRETRRWAKPVFDLRARLGLEPGPNPLIEGQFSALGSLTLFSRHFANAQPDWPPNASPTGFVFYDKRGEGFNLAPEPATPLSEDLLRFLGDGPPPVLFTLGSSAVTDPGSFYTESANAARELGVRALLLTGRQVGTPIEIESGGLIQVEEYVSYSAIMPLVSAVVHQGGIGTVAQTLRAGKPMLVVPWAHDQPDNGYRLKRLGVGRVLPRKLYDAHHAARELRAVLSTRATADRARHLADLIGAEDGLNAACDRIENILRN